MNKIYVVKCYGCECDGVVGNDLYNCEVNCFENEDEGRKYWNERILKELKEIVDEDIDEYIEKDDVMEKIEDDEDEYGFFDDSYEWEKSENLFEVRCEREDRDEYYRIEFEEVIVK